MTTDDKQAFLYQKFLQTAFVKDASQGYVVVKEFNLCIDPDVLQFASRCWAEHFHFNTHIDAVAGLPDAGARLAPLLAEMLRAKCILPSKRTSVIPGAWEDVVSYSNESFTMGHEEILSHIGFLKRGMKVLLVDDVVAHGTTAIAAIQAVQKAGASVIGFAVLFDKVWQGGREKIKQETGIDTFSLVHIKAITQDGKVILE